MNFIGHKMHFAGNKTYIAFSKDYILTINISLYYTYLCINLRNTRHYCVRLG